MMIKWILAAGAAAIALATPVLADPNKGKGDRGPKAAKVERGGGDHRGQTKAARADRPERAAKSERHIGKRAESRGNDLRHAAKADKEFRGKELRHAAKADKEFRGKDRVVVRDDVRIHGKNRDRDIVRIDDDDLRIVRVDNRGLIDGCPPGLAKKNNGCLPPGQARKLVGAVLPAAFGANMLAGPYRQWYQDNDDFYYRNDGDYIYRVNRDGGLIDALIPYGAYDYGYYPIGMSYPSAYNFYNVPDQYRPYYADSPDYLYRYGNNAIYQLDPQTSAIQGIVALLAGDLAVGQPLPVNYSMYNVPLAYRDRYYDTPDAIYRYNDGYIYRADPTTQLITAVIDAIV